MISLFLLMAAYSPTLCILFSGFVLIYLYFKYIYGYWKRKNIPYEPAEIPFGNLKQFIFQKKSVSAIVIDIYNNLKNTGSPFIGFYSLWKPTLIVTDLDSVKLLMTTEFQSFSSRTLNTVKNDPLTGHLLNLNGDEWKFMRSKLTPTFTSGKMKQMFQTITSCSENIQVVLEKHANTGEPLEVKDTMGRFTTDIIGSCAFGIECNSLKEPDNIFRKHGKKVLELTKADLFRTLFVNNFPKLSNMLGLKRIKEETHEFFMRLTKDTVSYRELNNVSRKDFLDLLIQLKTDSPIHNRDNKITETGKLTIEQIAAQCFVFFMAGFETSSTTLSSIMYELSRHQDIQDKTRQEIKEVLKKHNGELTYEAILDMKYLEQVIDESMRLHAVVPILGRKCTKDFTFPNIGLTVKKGTVVLIPAKAFHEDPQYYFKPEVFDPDRFSPEEKAKRHPYLFLPFGAGPRNCIGLRFGMLQMKVGLVALLQNYKFTLNSKTQTPLKQDPKSGLLNYIGGIWVDTQKI